MKSSTQEWAEKNDQFDRKRSVVVAIPVGFTIGLFSSWLFADVTREQALYIGAASGLILAGLVAAFGKRIYGLLIDGMWWLP